MKKKTKIILLIISIISTLLLIYFFTQSIEDDVELEKINMNYIGEWKDGSKKANVIVKNKKYVIDYNGYCKMSFTSNIYKLRAEKIKEDLLILEGDNSCGNIKMPKYIIFKFLERNDNYVKFKYMNSDDLLKLIDSSKLTKSMRSSFDYVLNNFILNQNTKRFENKEFIFNKEN